MTTRFGFTSVFDSGSSGENTRAIRRRIESGEVAGSLPLLKEKRTAITPTLSMWRFLLRHERAFAHRQAADEAVAQTKAWSSAEGEVL
jgi:hypothetical protein